MKAPSWERRCKGLWDWAKWLAEGYSVPLSWVPTRAKSVLAWYVCLCAISLHGVRKILMLLLAGRVFPFSKRLWCKRVKNKWDDSEEFVHKINILWVPECYNIVINRNWWNYVNIYVGYQLQLVSWNHFHGRAQIPDPRLNHSCNWNGSTSWIVNLEVCMIHHTEKLFTHGLMYAISLAVGKGNKLFMCPWLFLFHGRR
jgi:hypothetical protein